MLEKRSGQERRSENDRRLGYDTRTEAERQQIGERRSGEERRIGLDRRFDLEEIMEKCGIEPNNLLEQADILSDLLRTRKKQSQSCMQRISASIKNGGTNLELDKLNEKHVQIMEETRELRKQLEQVELQLLLD